MEVVNAGGFSLTLLKSNLNFQTVEQQLLTLRYIHAGLVAEYHVTAEKLTKFCKPNVLSRRWK